MDVKLILIIVFAFSFVFAFGMLIGYFKAINDYFKEDDWDSEFPKCTCGDPNYCDTWCNAKENFSKLH